MYVEKLTMKDFRCFEQAEASFVYPGKEGLPKEAIPNVTLLIGINGTGKTSVLRGVALAQLSPILGSSGYYPRHVVRIRPDGEMTGTARITTQFPSSEMFEGIHDKSSRLDYAPLNSHPGSVVEIMRLLDEEMVSSHTWESARFFSTGISIPGLNQPNRLSEPGPFFEDRSPEFFLIGYGATRRNEVREYIGGAKKREMHVRYWRVVGLFQEDMALFPLAAWYLAFESKARQKEVRDLLNGLLPDGTEFTGEFKDADAIFKHNGVKLPFGALSDGFRSYIGLVADMLYHLNYVCPKKSKLTDLSGVVMIDDIDVHLHPKWQREVVPKLAGTFPKLQFIITSHSPLVAGTLHAANIRVIEDNQIHEYTERIHGLSADQILLSSYFGHIPPRSPDAVDKLNRIADRVADDGDPSAAIEFLNELAGKSNGKHAGSQKPTKKKK